MPRLRYLTTAQFDLGGIYRYIRQQSGSGEVARRFVDRLRDKCTELADAPIRMGRPRPELLPDLRSHTSGRYIIFFRYLGDAIEIVNVLEGHRDIDSVFRKKGR